MIREDFENKTQYYIDEQSMYFDSGEYAGEQVDIRKATGRVYASDPRLIHVRTKEIVESVSWWCKDGGYGGDARRAILEKYAAQGIRLIS